MEALQVVASENGNGGIDINVWHGHTWVGEGSMYERGFIHSVGTNTRYRRRGVARFVVNELVKHAQINGLETVALNTYAGEKGSGARKCYKQVGFSLKKDQQSMYITLAKWRAPELTINEENLPEPIIITRHRGNMEYECRIREGDVVVRTDLTIHPGLMRTSGVVVGKYTNDTPETDLVNVRFLTGAHWGDDDEDYGPSITIYGGKLKITTCGFRVGDKVRMIHDDPKHHRKGTNFIGDHPEVLEGIATVTGIGGRYGGKDEDKDQIKGNEGGSVIVRYDTGFESQRRTWEWERVDG